MQTGFEYILILTADGAQAFEVATTTTTAPLQHAKSTAHASLFVAPFSEKKEREREEEEEEEEKKE